MNKVHRLHQDYKEFIELLNSHRVRHLIVGGISFGFHAQPRYTKDLDIWISRDQATAKRMMLVIDAFGFGDVEPPFAISDFLQDLRVRTSLTRNPSIREW